MRESFVLQLHVSVLEEGLARKLPLSQLPLSVLEGGLAQKLRLHIFNFDFSRPQGGLARKLLFSHLAEEGKKTLFVFTSSTLTL